MKFVKFVLLLLLNYLLKYIAMTIIAFIPSYFNDDAWDYIFDFLCLLVILTSVFIFVWILKLIIKNTQLNYILENKTKIYLKICLIFVLFESKLINLLYPIIYYYLFKEFLSRIELVKEFYLNFASMKKYVFIFFILESPLLLLILYVELFERSNELNWWWLVYYYVSIFIFYLPIFLACWWDNRRLQNNELE